MDSKNKKLVESFDDDQLLLPDEETEAEAVETPDVENMQQMLKRGKGNAFRGEVDELLKLYPEWKDKLARGEDLPREVIDACAKDGTPLRTAMAEYEVKRSRREIERLRREIAILRQNAASKAKAPIKGAASGGMETKGKDPFLEGLLSDD